MNRSFKVIIGLFTAVAIVTSVLYLFTYWYSFGINAFEFIDISNVVAYSVVPLLLSTGGFVYTVLHYFKRGYFFIPSDEGGNAHPKHFSAFKNSKRLKKWGLISFIVTMVLLVLANWFYFLWTLLPICIAPLIAGYLTLYKDRGRRFISDPDIRFVLLLVAVSFPLYGAAYGRKEAETIKHGDKYLYVGGTSITEEVRTHGDDKIRYLGTMGNYFFFLLPSDESIYIARQEDIKPFILRQYDRKRDKKQM